MLDSPDNVDPLDNKANPADAARPDLSDDPVTTDALELWDPKDLKDLWEAPVSPV